MNAGPINEYEGAELINDEQYLFFIPFLKLSEDCRFCLQFQLLCYSLEQFNIISSYLIIKELNKKVNKIRRI